MRIIKLMSRITDDRLIPFLRRFTVKISHDDHRKITGQFADLRNDQLRAFLSGRFTDVIKVCIENKEYFFR